MTNNKRRFSSATTNFSIFMLLAITSAGIASTTLFKYFTFDSSTSLILVGISQILLMIANFSYATNTILFVPLYKKMLKLWVYFYRKNAFLAFDIFKNSSTFDPRRDDFMSTAKGEELIKWVEKNTQSYCFIYDNAKSYINKDMLKSEKESLRYRLPRNKKMVLLFRKKSDAMLFKLTWYGAV